MAAQTLEMWESDADEAARRADAEAAKDAAARLLQADLTPHGVIRVGLEAIWQLLRVPDRPRFADVGCGYGPWAPHIRRACGQDRPHITGIEIDPDKHESASRWVDTLAMGDAVAVLQAMRGSVDVDVVGGNPPFELFKPETATRRNPPPDEVTEAVETSAVALGLAVAPTVFYLHQSQSFTRSVVGREIFRRYPPVATIGLGGSIQFRGTVNPKSPTLALYGADTHDHAISVWHRGHTGPTVFYLTRDLTIDERRWAAYPGAPSGAERQPPGTETDEQARAMGLMLAPSLG